MPTATSLSELIQLFNDNFSGTNGSGSMTLSDSWLDEAGTLVEYLNLTQLTISAGTLQSTNFEVTVQGTATVLSSASNVLLTGTVEGGQVRLTLSSQPIANSWTFGTDFSQLPRYKGKVPLGLKLIDSFLGTVAFSNPTYLTSTYAGTSFVEGINFTAGLDMTIGSLATIASYVPGSNNLEAAGTIALTSPYPSIDIKAPVPAFSLDLGLVTLSDSYVSLGVVFPTSQSNARSVCGLAGTVNVGSLPMVITAQMLQGTNAWTFIVDLPRDDPSYSLANGLAQLTQFLNGWDVTSVLPSSFPAVFDVYLTRLTATLVPSSAGLGWNVLELGATISSGIEWTPPIPKTLIKDLYVNWSLIKDGDGFSNFAVVGGTFEFEGIDLLVTCSYPDWTIMAQLAQGQTIPVGAAMSYWTGGAVDLGGMEVFLLELEAQPPISYYRFYTAISGSWPFPVPFAEMSQLNMEVDYSPNALSGYVSGQFYVPPRTENSDSKLFFLKAEKPPGDDAGWNFTGGLFYGQTFTAQNFVDAITLNSWNLTLPESLAAITLTRLFLSYSTKQGNFESAAALQWAYTIPNSSINLLIAAGYDIKGVRATSSDDYAYSGSVNGEFQVNDYGVSIIYTFEPNSNTIAFRIFYNEIWIQAALTNKTLPGPPETKESILKITFGDLSFGDIVKYLVEKANPNVTVKLESPWNLLNDINFKNLTLSVNLTTKEVAIDYKVGISLGFAYLDTVGLSYVKVKGKGHVKVRISGRFLDKTYGEDDPLSWDLMDDPPPKTSNLGSKLVNLKYMGLGQHVAIDNPGSFNNVEEVITALRDYMKPIDDPDINPISQTHGIKFDANSHWLFGLDIVVIGTVEVAVVFNDPNLYGLLIQMAGERAGALAGLKFEVLYVKITDDIGVFKIELRVPDAFRQLEFGSVSITLPTIWLEIYTNGNFKVNLGFPKGLDFSQSFAIQVFPFIGYGGIYFAYLNGTTSSRTPEISNGTFDPVIEAGFGLSVGLGKDFNKGPLKAGLTITVVGIVEGVLGWFNPDDENTPDPMYYWLQGTIAIVGKLWGEVDFVVIKVSVSVTAMASVTFTVEAYQPMLIVMRASVSVKATVKVLFVKVHFKFKLEIEESFTIGHASTPPWILGQRAESSSGSSGTQTSIAGDLETGEAIPGGTNTMLRMQNSSVANADYAKRIADAKLLTAAMLGMSVSELESGTSHLVDETGGDITEFLNTGELNLLNTLTLNNFDSTTMPLVQWNWDPKLAFDSVQAMELTMVPMFTVAEPQYLSGGGTGAAALQLAIALYAENTMPVGATTSGEAAEVSTASTKTNNAADAPFNLLVRGMFLYVLNSYPGFDGTSVTDAQLKVIQDLFEDQDTQHTGFSYANIIAFIANNYRLEISAIPDTNFPGQPSPTGAVGPVETSATIFPMIPELSMETPTGGTISFLNHRMVDTTYEDNITAYFEQMALDVTTNVAQDPLVPEQPSGSTSSTGSESMATLVFRDYFFMIAKGAVQEAMDVMTAYQYEVQDGDTLWSIANSSLFPRVPLNYEVQAGDTLESIAELFSMTEAAITAANPGIGYLDPLDPPQIVKVNYGVTVTTIAGGNADVEFATGVDLNVSNILHQVRAAETLTSISAPYDGQSAATLATEDTNSSNSELLNQGSTIELASANDQFVYATQAGDDLNFIGAYFITRNNIADVPSEALAWYQQTIADLNPTISFDQNPNLGAAVAITAGTPIVVPTAYNDSTAASTPYTSRPGDLLEWIAGYYALAKVETTPPNATLTAFTAGLTTANPTVDWGSLTLGQQILVPAIQHVLSGYDTFASLSSTFGIEAANLATVNATNTTILAPQAVLVIPDFTHATVSGDTLSSLAAQYSIGINELAVQQEQVSGIYPGATGTEPAILTIPDVPQMALTTLESTIVDNGHSNNIAGQVSRFMLHGLRAPEPPADTISPTTPLYGLYDLIGQQFTAPASIAGTWDVSFTNPNNDAWLQFFGSYVIQAGDTQTDITDAWSDAVVNNPHVDWANLATQVGVVIITDQIESPNPLEIELTQELLDAEAPSTTFSPTYTGPQSVALYHDEPVRYTLQQHMSWQAAANPTFPNQTVDNTPTVVEPTLWLLPTSLTSKIESGQLLTHPFEMAALQGTFVEDDVPTVDLFMWTTLVEFQVRKVADPSTPGQFLTNTVEIVGSSDGDRDRLERVFDYLTPMPAGESNPDIYLMYPPNATSNNPSGLVTDALNDQSTFILKTNLSTDTGSGTSGGGVGATTHVEPETGGETYAARFDAPVDFMRYLWEACITGSGGFYLNYVNDNGDAGIPGNAFDQSGQANIWLMIVLSSQSGTTPVRNLKSFNNAAIIGDNIDASKTNVYAEVADNSETQRIANMPAGNIGFELTRPEPEVTDWESVPPTIKTELLYNLMGFYVKDAGVFDQSTEGLPAGPTDPPGWAETGIAPWYYHHVMPVSTFAKSHPLALCAALPDPQLDPYAGIGITGGSLNQATISFDFHDVLGNKTTNTNPVPDLDVPVGYTDPVIGLAQWPGLSNHYAVNTPGNPAIELDFDFQVPNYVPGAGLAFEKAVYASSAHYERYKQVYYQINQDDVDFNLITSLQQTGGENTAFELPKNELQNFVSSIYTFLGTTMWLTAGTHQILAVSPVAPTTPTDPCVEPSPGVSSETLQQIATAYGTTVQDLAAANPDALAINIFTEAIEVPYYFTVGRNQTVETIVASANAAYSPATTLTATCLLKRNTTSVLTANITLAGPERTLTINPTAGDSASNSLRKIALANYCSVGSLANLNNPEGTGASILNAGVSLTMDRYTYVTQTGDSFEDITTAFNQQQNLGTGEAWAEYSTADVAVANQDVKGLIADNVTMVIDEVVTWTGATLATISNNVETYTAEVLASETVNQQLQNLWQTGQSLYLFRKSNSYYGDDTITTIANTYRITIQQLFASNYDSPLATGTTANSLNIPALVVLPSDRTLYVPYQVKENDTLTTLADLFVWTANAGEGVTDGASALGYLNLQVPNLVAGGQSVSVSGIANPITTAEGDSLQSIIDAFAAVNETVTFTQLMTAVQGQVGILNEGAFMAAGLPTSANTTFQDLSATYNIPIDSIAEANCSLGNFLSGTGSVTVQGITIDISANDTLTSLVNRFAAQKVTTTVQAIAEANPTAAIVSANRTWMLPPNDLTLAQQLGATYPANPSYPGTVFEIVMDFRVQRDKDNEGLFDPGFETEYTVQRNDTILSPKSTEGASQELSLTEFAVNFEDAFDETLKIGIGKNDGANDTSGVRHIWGVHFGTDGIKSVAIQRATPSYYSIKPLARQLVTMNDLAIQAYAAGQLGDSKNVNFKAVDMEVWAKQFLEAVDLFLSAPYAAAAYQIDGGPEAFQRVVLAKEALADAISGGLDRVLDVAGPAASLAQAQSALRDQLLINLTKAYDTDSIIQYDVDVVSSFNAPTGDPAPRFNGKPVVRTYTTGTADTPAIAAAALNVATLYFATTVQYMTGIVNSGLVVSYPAKPDYTIASSDTLAGLAVNFDVSLADLIANLTWSATGEGLFEADTIINVTGVQATTGTQTFETVADYFNLSVDDVANANADALGIFQDGKTVTYTDKRSEACSLEHNTLDKLAAAFGSPVLSADVLCNNSNVIDEEGIFAEGATISYPSATPITVDSTGTGSNNSLSAMAAAFSAQLHQEVTVSNLVQSIKDDSSILNIGHVASGANPAVPGKIITYIKEYNVVAGTTGTTNSLAGIASAMGTPTVSVAEIAEGIRSQTDLLSSTFVFYALQEMADYSLTTGKMPLEHGTNQLDFLMTVKTESEHRKVLMGLDYVINEMEYGINPVPDAPGYESSDWLTFVLPIGSRDSEHSVFDNSLGQPAVPIPLRTYPQTPAILSQTDTPSVPDGSLPTSYPENVRAARLWKFGFTFQHEDAQQDTSYVNVFFNRANGTGGISDETGEDYATNGVSFFHNLAQCISVLPDMQKDLATLLAPGGDATLQQNAVATFADLVANVARYWTYALNTGTVGVPAGVAYQYGMHTTSELGVYNGIPNVPLYHTLIMQADVAGISPSGEYPELYWVDDNGDSHILSKDPQGSECIYTYLEAVPAFTSITHMLEFDRLDVLQYQNALGGAFVRRNEDLAATPTASEFIFQTPEAVYNQVLTPFLRHDSSIEFPLGSGLQDALTDLFSMLLDPDNESGGDIYIDTGSDSRKVKVSASYGYQLAVGVSPGDGVEAPQIISYLPIVYRPVVLYSAADLPVNLAATINAWAGERDLATQGKRYVFDVMVFSTLDTELTRPLLELKHLYVVPTS